MYKQVEHTLELLGVGSTKEEAINDIFAKVQQQVGKEIKQPVLHIELKNMELLQAHEKIYTERLFGLFLNRTRKRYELRVKLTVDLKVIELAKIKFETDVEKLSPIQHILQMR